MATFTWTPDKGASAKHQPRVLKAPFGDGYTQRAKDGLHSDLPSWGVAFTERADADSIAAFLEARGGVESFDWSWKSGKKFICQEWSDTWTGHSRDISATFQEVPA